MEQVDTKDTVRTNLEMDRRLADRIKALATGDKRRFKAEILILLDEAATRREQRK